jgi:Bacterial archaeo-eukaryotic release factor family 3
VNRALLVELQRQRAYPSITVLMNTTPGTVIDGPEIESVRKLIEHADRRLDGEVTPEQRAKLTARLASVFEEHVGDKAGHAIALCVSPEYAAAVKLGRSVEERIVIDDTFATRDLVADLNRTALFRVVTISDRKTRLLIGDKVRLVEVRTDTWPMIRAEEQAVPMFTRDVAQNLGAEHSASPLPTVIAGVDRTVRKTIDPAMFDAIGLIPGNHDRTSWTDLHAAAWPLVCDWLRTDRDRAFQALARARSTRRFAGGLDEIWSLANEGRVETLVVEDGYAVPARLADGRIERVENREEPGVIDDLVDETIEAVLLHGGTTIIVPDGDLGDNDRIAAVLRY